MLPSKRRRLSTGPSIQALESQLSVALDSNTSLNPISDLLDLTRSCHSPQDTSKGIFALYRIFVLIITKGKLSPPVSDEDAKQVKAWLLDRLANYVEFLVGLLKDEEKSLRSSALQILFSLLKHLSSLASKLQSSPQIHISHFRKITNAILVCPPSTRPSSQDTIEQGGKLASDVKDQFLETWLSVFDDIRWFFLRESATILSKDTTHPHMAANLLSLLSHLTTFPTDAAELNAWWISEFSPKPITANISADDDDEEPIEDTDDDWRKFFDEPFHQPQKANTGVPKARLQRLNLHQSLHSLPSHRAVFTRTWLVLLPRLTVPIKSATTDSKALVMRALTVMHRGVLPHLTRPILVMDWISSYVDYGGSVSLLALNALFSLIKDYNLDYPSFYTRLYALLDRDVLYVKHRARFFRLTEVFLSSTHLPATLLASFVKRLARLSLTAPPAAIVMVIPFIYNILKRHPALMAMIHRDDTDDPDPYNPTEPNPLYSNALSSSLWEINAHRNHYHSAVSTLAKIFSEAFTKPNYAMEDFLDHTYSTLFETEATRKIKREPPVAMEVELGNGKQPNLFPTVKATQDDVGPLDLTGDAVSELWLFG